MGQDNSITIIGNITRDLELRTTPSGSDVLSFGVAVNRRWMNRANNEWQEDTSFFDVVCWQDLAQNVATTLDKGNRVIVSGRLEQRSWENEKGEKRSKVEIVADDIGPSLRWAQAEVQRTAPSGGGATQQPAMAGAGAPANNTGTSAYGEEPF